jgi:hypothetical protein
MNVKIKVAGVALALLTSLPASADFRILTLTANNATAIEHVSVTGDDRGGIAASDTQVFYTGDGATGRFSLADLTGGTSASQYYDGLVSDLSTETVYTLATSGGPVPYGGGTLTRLLEIDGATGALTGGEIVLSGSISAFGVTGIFAGFGFIVVHNGSNAYRIDIPSGTVTDLGAMSSPTRNGCENWAYWGVAENFGGSVYLDTATSLNILRTRVPDGLQTTLAAFSSLSDMCSFTVVPSLNRWYFHHEGTSQFRSGDETIGFADATFALIPGLLVNNTSPGAVQAIDYSVPSLGAPAGSIPNGSVVGDCVITHDGSQGFVTNFGSSVFPVDLTGAIPVVGSAIAVSLASEDVTLTPDDKFLLVTDGGGAPSISVVDVDLGTEIGTFAPGGSVTSVDACDDGGTVIAGAFGGTLFRLNIDGFGALSSGSSVSTPVGTNAYCAPGSSTAVSVDFSGSSLRSYTLPGLGSVDVEGAPNAPIAAAFNGDGTRIFVRGDSATAAYPYDPVSGNIGTLLWSVSTPSVPSYYGIDQIAVTPNGGDVYVPNASGVRILDATTGATIMNLAAPSSTGVCFFGPGAAAGQAARDFGDAPSPYPTLLADDGARHRIVINGPALEDSPDAEFDGQPNSDATGDDDTGSADEDGVSLPTFLFIGQSNDITVSVTNVSSSAVLDAWFDFNDDGDWNDSGEHAISGLSISDGENTLSVSIPESAEESTSFARFRLSTAGSSLPTGEAADGEVEDYQIQLLKQRDFGDAPFPYPTLLTDGGARHNILDNGPALGVAPDNESDGQPDFAALGDDNNYGDDEDGVTLPDEFESRDTVTIQVEVSNGPALLDAWFDFNADGDWNDDGENVLDDYPVVSGTNQIDIEVPDMDVDGVSFARFRISSSGVSGPTGQASDGEVEDYAVNLDHSPFDMDPPAAPAPGPTSATPGAGGALPLSMLLVLMLAGLGRRRWLTP